MLINYDIMEDILDDDTMVSFSKPNRVKTHPLGKRNYDSWYEDKPHTDAIAKNWPKIKGLLKKNAGNDFGKVKNEIIQKCAHNDYDRYLIKDYLQNNVYNYTDLPNYRYLHDMFYIDENGKLQYRANPEVNIGMKDNRYATFPTPENERFYRYEFRNNFRKSSKLLDDSIELVFCKKFPNWSDYEIRTFKEDEVNIIVDELVSLSPLIKSIEPVFYKYYNYFHFNNRTDISEKEIIKSFVKSYLFSKHCINPYTMVEKNSQDYWRLRKIFEKKK